ncbi:molecular chaperone TorD [Shewanella atlantica]|uniref:Chaperone protein TorD n=1 Tax=Shewanella atlantica TaxID=271099 RepID=A0A431WBF4_9GAMM|nr:molecular chaperone TorD [Shewanella atlantica]RTR32833.1 molecular chaperone TorD [Shewanella atlantica]
MNREPVTDSAINQARGMVYQLLSSLFAKEVDHQLLHELTSEQAQGFWAQLASESAFKADVDTLVSVLSELKSDKALLELAADYCGLFLVGTKHSASPYASLYLEDAEGGSTDEPTLFGEQHQLMLQFLKQSQLQVQSSFPEPADHLAVILAYAAHLCNTADEAAQLEFIESYLNNWVGNFAAKVTQCDSGQFYSALTRLTQSWIQAEVTGLRAEQ